MRLDNWETSMVKLQPAGLSQEQRGAAGWGRTEDQGTKHTAAKQVLLLCQAARRTSPSGDTRKTRVKKEMRSLEGGEDILIRAEREKRGKNKRDGCYVTTVKLCWKVSNPPRNSSLQNSSLEAAWIHCILLGFQWRTEKRSAWLHQLLSMHVVEPEAIKQQLPQPDSIS